MIQTYKYHSYGNDFLIPAPGQVDELEFGKFARSICRPHQGLGADGCIFVTSTLRHRFSIRIFNRDGSEASMSGNGVRCCCAYLHHQGLSQAQKLEMETASGLKIFELIETFDHIWRYRSQMGVPRFIPAEIPFETSERLERIEDHLLSAAGHQLRVSALNVGNPQCVVLVEELPDDEGFERVGSALEIHGAFPERTNVSFLKVEDQSNVRIRIWERGVGPTFSSGTGSCGAAVTAIHKKLVTSPVTVWTETGNQIVEWEPGGEVVLTGQAEFVASGSYLWRDHE